MKSLYGVALLAVALLAACSDGNDGPGACAGKTGVAGTREITIRSGGLERTFQLDVPESALTGHPVPLVLVYHGVLATGPEIQEKTEFPAKAAAEGFITAAGDGSCLAVLSDAESDVGQIAYEMALLVKRVGEHLAAEPRNESAPQER